jgi:UDP-N-acetylmuramoyl-tripeptide--D-alanyl-D-alanine ligase
LAEPQYGVVTNVGFAHVESFRSIDEVAAAKRELIEALPADGVAILNADDARVRTFGDVHPGRTFTYGFRAGADLQATDVEITSTGAAFTAGRVRFHTSLSGRHGVSNVLAGLAVARLFGIALIDLVDAVARLKLGHMRGERHHWRGMTVLNDAYNSNPEAARNMIDVLCGQHPGKMAGRRIAVLGEMRELGHMSRMLHGELGRYAVRAGVNILIGVAGDARYMVDAAVDSGFAREAAFFFDDAEAAGAFLREFTAPGDVLLFKGSRGTHVERALDKMET